MKKFVHFRADSRGKPTIPAHDKLLIYFRPVTSTACTFEVAERLGRQPEMDIESEALNHVAPKRQHRSCRWSLARRFQLLGYAEHLFCICATAMGRAR